MKQTALNARHRALGARMVEFGGWEMPLQYEGIVAEHQMVRSAGGLFDLQHMGRLRLTGPDRAAALDRVLTNDVPGTPVGHARYAVITDEAGCAIDDAIYYVLPEAILLVVNASNREAVLDWIRPRLEGDVRLTDETERWAMIAVQGSKCRELLQPLCDADLGGIKYYRSQGGVVLGEPCLLARTGYTGELGYELVFDATQAGWIWDELVARGAPLGIRPAGLGCRDTLRLEAGMALYGHELDRETNPLEAGLEFGVKLDRGAFCGREALLQVQASGPAKRLVGFEVEGGRIPRQGAAVFQGGEACGKVTSGTKSPTLNKVICLAYVSAARVEATDGFEVEVSGKRYPLRRHVVPFFSRTRKG